MKAWILENQAKIEDRPIQLREIPTPEPSDHEIRIKVHACGVCRTDIHVAEGDLPLKKSPLILGHEVVGIVDKAGNKVTEFQEGDRAGVAWLNHSCGRCEFCRSGRENLCTEAQFTGWDADGGYAEFTVVEGEFAYHLPGDLNFEELAPLMCPGIAGYRSLRLTNPQKGQKVCLYGFGPTASYVLQVAKHLGLEVFVVTRSQKNRDAARDLSADWVGSYDDEPPAAFDSGIIFPPAGNLVEFALSQLKRDGRLILAPVYMTPIEIKDYNNIWLERSIKSLAHISRQDGKEFLQVAGEIRAKTQFEIFPFDRLAEVLPQVKRGKINGNAVIKVI
ncbi:MAG: zinc-dependent alcohol dehydrogenase family protein [Thermodesulfobacteriota bacterium]